VEGHVRLQALGHMAGQPPLLASPATLALVDHVVRIMQGPCNSEDPPNVWLHGAPGNGMSTLLRQAARVTEHVTPNMMAAYIPLVSGTECMLNVQYVALRLVQSRDMLTPAGMDFMHKPVPANVDLLCDALARHRMTMTLYLDNAEALLSDKRFSGSIADYETTQANLEFVQQLMAAGGPVRCVMASSSTSAPLKFSGQWAAAAAAWSVRGGATFFFASLACVMMHCVCECVSGGGPSTYVPRVVWADPNVGQHACPLAHGLVGGRGQPGQHGQVLVACAAFAAHCWWLHGPPTRGVPRGPNATGWH